MTLAHDAGGAGPRVLVLLHGLGTTREVWQPMLASADRCWNGRWLAPDLRGHGRSAHEKGYAIGLHAADVAALTCALFDATDIIVLGHSMGGAIALALASGWFGINPTCVFGLGIKVAWTEDELAQLAKVSATPRRLFDSKAAAVERYLKVSGLAGLVAPQSPMAGAGVTAADDGWMLAADPATASVGPPTMHALLAAARAPSHLARGISDPMVTRDQLLAYDAHATDLPGGHNAMVERPDTVWTWLEENVA